MPELPEVETLRRALVPLIENKTLVDIDFLRKDLRYSIPVHKINRQVKGQKIRRITRQGKYLLLHVKTGSMLWHLGMSGRVTQYPSPKPVQKHTHAVFHFASDLYIHFVDPRRFGCILWVPKGERHILLQHLGPDPFSPEANPQAMQKSAYGCGGPIKSFLMNAKRLAGIGNIYACEALFSAGIHPKRAANTISLKAWDRLLNVLRATLDKSIASGGTTLRDFFSPEGEAGYFSLKLSVYGKEGQPCPSCQTPIKRIVYSGRSTFFCKVCQKI